MFPEGDLPYYWHVAERVGIFGGTFDPIHVAHLVAAVEARNQLSLDRLLVVVAREPWQKQDEVIAPPEIRYEMVKAAIVDVEGVEVSDIEMRRSGPTYTIDTVEELARQGRELVLVLGADAACALPTWKRSDELRRLVSVAVLSRNALTSEDPPEGWDVSHVSMPRLDISSSEIRARVAQGRPIDGLVPPGAVRLLREARLYTHSR
jgi:nicotinate-nucleotide adenylyltransferase